MVKKVDNNRTTVDTVDILSNVVWIWCNNSYIDKVYPRQNSDLNKSV